MAKMQSDVGLGKKAFYRHETFQTPVNTEQASLTLYKCVRQESHNQYKNKKKEKKDKEEW